MPNPPPRERERYQMVKFGILEGEKETSNKQSDITDLEENVKETSFWICIVFTCRLHKMPNHIFRCNHINPKKLGDMLKE